MTTYAQFQAESLRRQRAYIREERHRYRTLDTIRRRLMPEATPRGSEPLPYKLAAHALGLHAQQEDEIAERLAQLDQMWAEAPTSHGDGPAMRTAYEFHVSKVAAS